MLRERLPRAELLRRLELLYRPYHRTLLELLEAKRRQFGFAVLLCAHSMPSRGRSGHTDTGATRADLVPGSRGRTSAANRVLDEVDQAGRAAGFSIRHDDPYRGGHSTRFYGRPAEHLHAIQVELSRALYLDEDRCRLQPEGLARVQEFAQDLVERLGQLELPRWRGARPSASKST